MPAITTRAALIQKARGRRKSTAAHAVSAASTKPANDVYAFSGNDNQPLQNKTCFHHGGGGSGKRPGATEIACRRFASRYGSRGRYGLALRYAEIDLPYSPARKYAFPRL